MRAALAWSQVSISDEPGVQHVSGIVESILPGLAREGWGVLASFEAANAHKLNQRRTPLDSWILQL